MGTRTSKIDSEVFNESWLDLKGRSFIINDYRWYNLRTNRIVKNLPTSSATYSIRNVRVIGTYKDIVDFHKINSIDIDENMIYQPIEDIEFLSTEIINITESSNMNKLNTKKKLKDITKEEINNMDLFSFNGMFVKGRVAKVIDGDTLRVIVHIPLKKLMNKYGSFNTLIKIRTYGYDAQEKNTGEGKIAKELFKEKLESLDNIIWCYLLHNDKYGRTLAVLFEDKRRKVLLNDYLFKKEKEKGTLKLVNTYLGGKKDKF
jgi:endonuclease YncB( thermonuclease family)